MIEEKENKSINEVHALREVLFKFFKSDQGGGSAGDKHRKRIVKEVPKASTNNPF
jgi:hypothetical protein